CSHGTSKTRSCASGKPIDHGVVDSSFRSRAPASYRPERVRTMSPVQAVILCGGLGTRLAEETEIRPKPMVEIGGRPILWHIMKLYSHYNFKEFYIALGYKGEVIKRFFFDYYSLNGNISINFSDGQIDVKNR